MRTLSCMVVVSLLAGCSGEPSEPPFGNPNGGGQTVGGSAAGTTSSSGSGPAAGGAPMASAGTAGTALGGSVAVAGANGSSAASGGGNASPGSGGTGTSISGAVGQGGSIASSSGRSAGGTASGAGTSPAGAPGSAGQPPAPATGAAACGTAPPGVAVGSPIENFELTDQLGNKVSLSSYCDKVVYIVAGAMWCPGCRTDAAELEAIYQQYKEQGLVTLSLVAENSRARTPTPAELMTWATTYGITTPVLADPEWKVWLRYWPARATPKELLIGRNGIIADLTYPGTRDIERALR